MDFGDKHSKEEFRQRYWRSVPGAPGVLPDLNSAAAGEESMRQLAEHLPVLCWIANGDGYIVWYNRTWHDYCGTTAQQMEGWGWQATHDPQLLPAVMERWTTSIATGQPFEMTFPLRGADGIFRPFLTRARPVRDATGRVARWFGVNTEIFDQVAAEAALRAERDRTKNVLEGMAEGFVLLDRSFHVIDINAEGLRIDRREREAIVGKSHWDVWPGTEHSEQGAIYRRVMSEHISFETEVRHTWEDGREVWFEVRAHPHPEGAAIFYRDVSDRKRAETRLRDSEAFVRLMLDSTSEAFYALDRTGATTMCNQSFLRMLGFANRDAVIGRNLHDVIHHSHPDGKHYRVAECPIYQAATTGTSAFVSSEVFFRLDGTAFPVEYRVEPLMRDGKLQGAVCNFSDITVRRRAEARQQLFLALGDAVNGLADPRSIVAATVEILGRHMGVSRAGYGEVCEDDQSVVYETDYANGVDHLVGSFPLDAFGPDNIAELRLGRTTTYADLTADPRTRDAGFAAIEARAAMAVPMIRDGRLRALLYLNHREVRQWSVDEVALIQEVAARTWDLLERARAETELQRAVALNASILQSSRDCTVVLDLEGRTLFVSPGGIEAMEISDVDSILGLSWLRVWTGETNSAARRAVEQAAQGGIGRFQGMCPTHRGTPKWWDVAITPMVVDGKLQQLVSVGRDVTQQVLVQQRADHLGERQRALGRRQKLLYDLICQQRDAQSESGVRQLASALVGHYFAASHAGFLGLVTADSCEYLDGWAAEDAPVFAGELSLEVDGPALATLFAGKAFVVSEARTGEGSTVSGLEQAGWSACLAVPIVRGGSWQAAFYVTDTKPRLWSADDVALAQEVAEMTWDAVQRLRAEGALRDARATLEKRVQERTEALRQTEEALRQAQKMEAVGQLTGGVAHDFNNLLTVIKSSTDLLKRPNLTDERRTRYITAISDTVGRAAKLTGQLLAFARRQALKPEVFDAVASVKTIGEMMGTLTGSRIRIVSQMPDRPCYLNADPNQFDTSLVNMVVNARDAMNSEGQLTVNVRPVELLPAARSHREIEGPYVAVSIADTGIGIASEDRDKIFEPFFTTKGVGQGTGLGLSQVFGFAKQSGGDIFVESKVGEGSTFTLYLPRVEEPVPSEPLSEAMPLMDGHGTRVLVVEDNPQVGTFATQTLEELGYHSVWTSNAEEALAELARNADTFDVVFTDVIMPGMNGIELGKEIRRRYHDLPVVLTSGYSHVLAQNGTYGFELLHKPYSVEDLSRTLRKAAKWKRRKREMGP